MIVYRIARAAYCRDLTGKGAEKAGGRWNSKGIPMVYAGSSRALCTAEIAVHLPLGLIPVGYELATLEIPDKFGFAEPGPDTLPVEWNAIPYIRQTQLLGDRFIREKRNLVMRVPSAVVQGDHNYLINPLNNSISEVKILTTELFRFDDRLFRR